MVNAVFLHCPADADRARWLGQAWSAGRATLCIMGPHRRRIALGARSVLIGLWSNRSDSDDEGRQFASVLGQSPGRALLVVWDGRPPLSAVTEAGVPVVIASEEPAALLERLQRAAQDLFVGQAVEADLLGARAKRKAQPPPDARKARSWGMLAGALLGVLLALGGLAPFVMRLVQGQTVAEQGGP